LLLRLREKERKAKAHEKLRAWTHANDDINRLVRRMLDGEHVSGHAGTDQG
jgi:hypothetical protein